MRISLLAICILLALCLSGCGHALVIRRGPANGVEQSLIEPEEVEDPEAEPEAPAIDDAEKKVSAIVINLSCEKGTVIAESGSFSAKDGDVLQLEITADNNGGSVDFILTSPGNTQQLISITGQDWTENIPLSEGQWGYNCTGSSDDGRVKIVGTIR